MMREPAFSQLQAPAATALRGKRVLVLGLGDSGLSVARWVESQGGSVRVADTRAAPPRRGDFGGEFHAGAFEEPLLEGMDLMCVSPGVALEEAIVRAALARQLPIVGDVELFAWHVRRETKSRVIAVTGTNGKSTVTALTAHLLRTAGVDCEAAGNISPPALLALQSRREGGSLPAVWVLELSSYQLETAWSLDPDAAAMLNLTEDHLDRYAGLAAYESAKARVFRGQGVQVLNRDDPRSAAMALPQRARMTFGLDAPPRPWDFGLHDGQLVQGGTPFFRARDLPLHGAHNLANALAASALARAMGLPLEGLAPGLASYRGLPHRVELVATLDGVDWYDDSKGTNVGATVAALNGLGRKVVLIAGGEGKGQDFSPLAAAVARFARKVLLIGRDAPAIEQALRPSGVATARCPSIEEAVRAAARSAVAGDAVLLSPACASFDMFRDYRHRGEAFAAAVKALR